MQLLVHVACALKSKRNYHHNFLHDCATEAFYIGFFDFELQVTGANGNGFAHEIHNLDLHHNKIVRSGWDSIQVSSATTNSRVFDNYVEDFATLNVVNQNNGIILQAGFKGDCFNNVIIQTRNGTGVCLLYQGSLGSNIFNNVIRAPVGGQTGISASVSSVRTNPGTFLNIMHNTVISLGERGISVFFQAPGPVPNTQKIQNNVVTWRGSVAATWESISVNPTTGASISNVSS